MDASRVQLYRAFLALDSVGLQRSQIGEERILGGKEWCLLFGQLKFLGSIEGTVWRFFDLNFSYILKMLLRLLQV